MLKIYDFNRSNQEQKLGLVLAQGNFIQTRFNAGYNISLYSMGKFFAEIWYRSASQKVYLVRGFSNQEMLEPYLEDIDLTDITD